MLVDDNTKISSSSCFCFMKCFPLSSSSPPSPVAKPEEESGVIVQSKSPQRKPGGWKSMPYVLGLSLSLLSLSLCMERNVRETSNVRVASQLHGLLAYSVSHGPGLRYKCLQHLVRSKEYGLMGRHQHGLAPRGGLSSLHLVTKIYILSSQGMVTLTLTAAIPKLHPPPCTAQQLQHDQCIGPTKSQLGVLYLALGLLTVGAGGIRPCSLPFGVDQFDHTTDEGRKGINSFFNWYYFTFTVVVMIALTLIVYIQDSISWAWGLGIPATLMLGSIVLFFLGTRVYVYVQPEGSVFSGIAQVFVAAYKKRHLTLPPAEEFPRVLYDPPLKGTSTIVSKLPLTQQFRILNKASIIFDGELSPDGSRSKPWRLCSIKQVEEVKCLIRIVPIWATGIICFTAITQQGTFTVSQALKMDRHLGPNFQIPAGSLGVISMLTLGLWIPIYDRLIVPTLRKITKHEGGITLLQRMGIGILFSIISMVVSGLVEEKRRASAILHARPDGIAPITVMWLAPQLILMGFAEAFNIIGQIEFFYKQFPEHMRSIANSLFFCTMGGASYLSSLVVTIVDNSTGKHGRSGWLAKDINAGRVDYYYFVIAAMGFLNLIYFLVCAQRYHYKGSEQIKDEGSLVDIELTSTKHKN
ncbi:hypothetical protein HHK36_007183 [Tetracentron sinense]|uniref:Uncharacterized protein n=1 Tax=Tetracentron sinense TaxID=13715 RepID=A0A835DLD4_TETSI|nr:hypothetical protein HHK36_007183 [Tetracentron sinense]